MQTIFLNVGLWFGFLLLLFGRQQHVKIQHQERHKARVKGCRVHKRSHRSEPVLQFPTNNRTQRLSQTPVHGVQKHEHGGVQSGRRHFVGVNGGGRPKGGKGDSAQGLGRQALVRVLHGGVDQEAYHVADQRQDQDEIRAQRAREGATEPKHGGASHAADQAAQTHGLSRAADFAQAHVGKVLNDARGDADDQDEKEKEEGVRVVDEESQSLTDAGAVVLVGSVFVVGRRGLFVVVLAVIFPVGGD